MESQDKCINETKIEEGDKNTFSGVLRPKLTVYELRVIPQGFMLKELFFNLTAYELPRVGVFKELLEVHIFNLYDFWAF